MFKDQVIRFRCTPAQRKMVEDLARNDGKSLSQFLLDLCYREEARRIQSVTSDNEFAEWYGTLLSDPKREKVAQEIMNEIRDVKVGDAVIW